MYSFAEMINEAIREKEQAKRLLREGKIQREEARHRIVNAHQVILFARTATEREQAERRELRKLA